MIRSYRSPFQERWKQHCIIPSPHNAKRTLLQFDRLWSLRMARYGSRIPILYNRYPICELHFEE